MFLTERAAGSRNAAFQLQVSPCGELGPEEGTRDYYRLCCLCLCAFHWMCELRNADVPAERQFVLAVS